MLKIHNVVGEGQKYKKNLYRVEVNELLSIACFHPKHACCSRIYVFKPFDILNENQQSWNFSNRSDTKNSIKSFFLNSLDGSERSKEYAGY